MTEQSMVNFRMDKELKSSFDSVCRQMGMTATAAFTVFATKVVREKRIPFEINADPFYSKDNIERLKTKTDTAVTIKYEAEL